MALGLYLLKQTRINLIEKAQQGAYVAPQHGTPRGLSDFISDLAWRSMHYHPEVVAYVPQSPMQRTRGIINPLFTQPLTVDNVSQFRPKLVTATLNIVVESMNEYERLARQINIPQPSLMGEAQDRQKMVSDYLNLIGFGIITPGRWPNQIEDAGLPEEVTQQIQEQQQLAVEVNAGYFQKQDIKEHVTVLLSDEAYEHLIRLAKAVEAIPAQVYVRGALEDFKTNASLMAFEIRSKAGWKTPATARGLSQYLNRLSYCQFIDDRDSMQKQEGLRGRWSEPSFKRRQRVLTIAPEARENYCNIAIQHKIFPPVRTSEAAVTGAVLEAIGLQLLKPVNLPTSSITHGPDLVNEPGSSRDWDD